MIREKRANDHRMSSQTVTSYELTRYLSTDDFIEIYQENLTSVWLVRYHLEKYIKAWNTPQGPTRPIAHQWSYDQS